MASLPQGPGRSGPQATARRLLPAPALDGRPQKPAPLPLTLFYHFLNAPGGFFVCCSLVAWTRGEADSHEGLPEAAPSPRGTGAGGVHAHWWRGQQRLGGASLRPVAPTAALTLQPAEVGLASPPLPARFISAFCLEGGVFHNYLKNAKQGVPESRIGLPPGRGVHPRRHSVSPASTAGRLCGSALPPSPAQPARRPGTLQGSRLGVGAEPSPPQGYP